MDMTRDFIEKLQEMDTPHTFETSNGTYCDKDLNRIPTATAVKQPLHTETLTSIVDYIRSNADASALSESGRFIVHVENYNRAVLYKELNADKNRDTLISAKYGTEDFGFGQFMPLEQFIISLQAAFVQDGSTAQLLSFVSSVRNDSSVTQNDDGVGQTVTVRQGISLAQKVTAPNPVALRPYRTFAEIEQPESNYVFRIKKTDDGAYAALFPADGDHWKHTAITSIANYLESELLDNNVIVLA